MCYSGRLTTMPKRIYRIHRGSQYREIFNHSSKITGRYIVLLTRKNELGYSRFGIITSKKVGGAVVRNRVKRRLRALIRLYTDKIKPGCDSVIIARVRARESNYQNMEKDFLFVLKKAKLL